MDNKDYTSRLDLLTMLAHSGGPYEVPIGETKLLFSPPSLALLNRFGRPLTESYTNGQGEVDYTAMVEDMKLAAEDLNEPYFQELTTLMHDFHAHALEIVGSVDIGFEGLESINYALWRKHFFLTDLPPAVKERLELNPDSELAKKIGRLQSNLNQVYDHFLGFIAKAGLELNETDYSAELYQSETNIATISRVKADHSGRIVQRDPNHEQSPSQEIPDNTQLYVQKGHRADIFQLFHELVAWYYISKNKSRIPQTQDEVNRYKGDLATEAGRRFKVIEAILLDPNCYEDLAEPYQDMIGNHKSSRNRSD